MTTSGSDRDCSGLPGFALPLTAFEEYLLRDGTPAAPMEFFFRLRLGETIDRNLLEMAAATALRRHPILQARVLDRAAGPPAFSFHTVPPLRSLVVEADDDGTPEPLDPQTDPLVRLTLSSSAPAAGSQARSTVLAQFHHVAADGLGAIAFLDDLLAIITQLHREATTPPQLRPLDPSLLVQRGHYGLTPWRLLKMLPDQAVGLAGIKQFFQNQPLGLTTTRPTTRPTGDSPRPSLTAISVSLSVPETVALRQAATTAEVTVNELAAAAIFSAIQPLCSIGRTAATGAGPEVVRLCVPMNLRRPSDRKMPATNLCSMVFLDRTPDHIAAGPAPLLTSIHDEMAIIRRHGLGLTFLFSLHLGRLMPGGIRRVVAGQPAAATVLFTNLGRVFRRHRSDPATGTSLLTTIEGLAPLRRETPLAITATEYAASLTFTFRYDERQLTAGQVAATVTAFRQGLDDVARVASSTTAASGENCS